jgi:hypothetical protein
MTESQLITLGYRYERANGARAQALRHSFSLILSELHPETREQHIYLFNKGIEEARMQVGRQEIRGAR